MVALAAKAVVTLALRSSFLERKGVEILLGDVIGISQPDVQSEF